MEEKKNSNKLTIVAFLSIVALAFLVVFTNSKFQEAVGIASDSGRVAFFIGDESMTCDLPGLDMAPGDEPQTFEFTVSNFKDSQVTEVATKYTVTINNGDATNPLGTLPLTYKLSRTDDPNEAPQSLELGEDNNFSYTSDMIPPGSLDEKTYKYKLEITWPDTERNIIYDNQLKVPRLTFKVEQVD